MKNDLLKLIAAAIVLVVGVTAAQALTTAGPHRPATVPADYVITPFGYFHPSCVGRVASGDELLPDQGVIRHADAGYPEAIATARDRGVVVPRLRD